MSNIAFQRFAIAVQVVYVAAFIGVLFLPKGELKKEMNLALLCSCLILLAVSFYRKKKRWDEKKKLKLLRDELLEEKWKEEHHSTVG